MIHGNSPERGWFVVSCDCSGESVARIDSEARMSRYMALTVSGIYPRERKKSADYFSLFVFSRIFLENELNPLQEVKAVKYSVV